jgi:hypothetical protein
VTGQRSVLTGKFRQVVQKEPAFRVGKPGYNNNRTAHTKEHIHTLNQHAKTGGCLGNSSCDWSLCELKALVVSGLTGWDVVSLSD